jgi:hypothetical protein
MKTKNRLTLLLSALAVLISAPGALADVQQSETAAIISQVERMEALDLKDYLRTLIMEYRDVEKEYLGEFATDDVEYLEERKLEFECANLPVRIEIDALLQYMGQLENPDNATEFNRGEALARAFAEVGRRYNSKHKIQ